MTSATSEHHLPNLPAWYRLLPKPPTEHNPALRRTSSLSQHHLFHDRSQNYASSGEDGPRRATVHVPESSNSTKTTQVYIGEPQRPSDGGSGSASPSVRGRSLEMAETQSHPAAVRSNSNSRENLCLCPASPKIPRPRNCEAICYTMIMEVLTGQQPSFCSVSINKLVSSRKIQVSRIRKYQRLLANNGVVCPPRPKRNGICLRKYVEIKITIITRCTKTFVF